jgi:hypothetical protein
MDTACDAWDCVQETFLEAVKFDRRCKALLGTMKSTETASPRRAELLRQHNGGFVVTECHQLIKDYEL